jgi:hypothetical protein
MHKKLVLRRHVAAISVFVCAGLLGFLLIAAGRAATFATSIEAEAGTVTGLAVRAANAAASSGNAIQFGGAACSALPGGSDNAQIAFNFFVSKGFTTQQSAGVIGNLMQESHVDPKAVQSGGPGRGIAQWSLNDRWATLLNWAGSRDPWALQTQLDFMVYELNGTEKATIPAVKATSTPSDAAYQFQLKYERAGTPNDSARSQYANDAFSKYAATAPPVGCAGKITGL